MLPGFNAIKPVCLHCLSRCCPSIDPLPFKKQNFAFFLSKCFCYPHHTTCWWFFWREPCKPTCVKIWTACHSHRSRYVEVAGNHSATLLSMHRVQIRAQRLRQRRANVHLCIAFLDLPTAPLRSIVHRQATSTSRSCGVEWYDDVLIVYNVQIIYLPQEHSNFDSMLREKILTFCLTGAVHLTY